MTTAIDSNVIVALWNEDETQNLTAKKTLGESQMRGGLVICGAVYAELMAAPGRSETFVDRFCEEAGIVVEWELGEKAWRAAGEAFQSYAERRRRQKEMGPRQVLADFFDWGACASERIQTVDARRRYLSGVVSAVGDCRTRIADSFQMSVFSKRRHVLEAEVDGFADVGEGFGNGLALRVAAGDRRTNHDVAAVVLVGLEKDFEVAGGHGVHHSPGL